MSKVVGITDQIFDEEVLNSDPPHRDRFLGTLVWPVQDGFTHI